MEQKRIGVLGGTFDPIHTGHIQLARRAMQYCNLACVFFVPVFVPSHKNAKHISSYKQRCDAVERRIKNEHNIFLSYIESTLPTPSYSICTYRAFQEQYPSSTIYWLTGSTDYTSMHTWYDGESFLSCTNIIIVPRLHAMHDAVHKSFSTIEKIDRCANDCFTYIKQYVDVDSTTHNEHSTIWHIGAVEHIFLHVPYIPISSTLLRAY